MKQIETKLIPIGSIFVGENYRKYLSEKETIELSQSIVENGLIHPITVIQVPEEEKPETMLESEDGRYYKAIIGSRRFFACDLAELSEIRCSVVEIDSEDEIAELQLTENIQRKDVAPLDEAKAFKQYIDKTNFTLKDLALKVGKDASFVYRRLMLLELTKKWQKLLSQDAIPVSSALEICRCKPEQQKMLYKHFVNEDKIFSGTQKDVKTFIQTQFNLCLNDAPFPMKTDNYGNDNNPACEVCAYNTATDNLLFPDYEKNYCQNSTCFIGRVQTARSIRFAEYLALIGSSQEVVLVSFRSINSKNWQELEYLNDFQHYDVYVWGDYEQVEEVTTETVKAFVVDAKDGNEIGKIVDVELKKIKNKKTSASSSNSSSPGLSEAEKKEALDNFPMGGKEEPKDRTEEVIVDEKVVLALDAAHVTDKPSNMDWQQLTLASLICSLNNHSDFLKAFFIERISDIEEMPEFFTGLCEIYASRFSKEAIDEEMQVSEEMVENLWKGRNPKEEDISTSTKDMLVYLYPSELISMFFQVCSVTSKKRLNVLEKQVAIKIIKEKGVSNEPLLSLLDRLKK